MKIDKIEDVRVLEGGMDINTLEELIVQLVQLFSVNKTSWLEGIELINELIYLKKHDGSVLSAQSSKLILDWIGLVYDNKIFEGFEGSYSEENQASQKIVSTLDLTTDTILKIRHNRDVVPFLNSLLKQSSNEFESYEIKELMDAIKEIKASPKQVISDEVLDQVLQRTDEYFELIYKTKEQAHLLCGLRQSIVEHELCYTINWCLKSEKYQSRVKKTLWVGAGALMISKHADTFEMMGSAPGIDWIHLFELKLQELEEYFCLEIPYQKEQISKLKSVIKCSTSELLTMLNEQKKIIYTEPKGWSDLYPKFQHIADDLQAVGIDCQVEIKTRKIAAS